MRLANIISGSAFRVSLQLLAVFVGMLALAGSVLVTAVTNTLENEVRVQVEEESLLFEEIYQVQGLKGLISSINELSRQSLVFNHTVGLFDKDHVHLAGQISLAPDFVGWQKTHLTLKTVRPVQVMQKITISDTEQTDSPATQPDKEKNHPTTQEQNFHARVFKLDQMTLVVGRNTHHIAAAKQQLIFWLLVTGSGLSVGTLLLGYLASRRSYHKLQAMGQVLKAIAGGDMNARITVADDQDQIDQLAAQVNGQLQRLAILVNGIQTTATAIAHDLKTPLSHAQIALYDAGDKCDRGEDPEQEINQALAKLDQLNQTFDTILRISRIQTHTDRSAFAQVELNALAEKIFDLLEPGAQDAGMQLSLQPARQSEIWLTCDSGMVQQLMINLLTNAITHCPAGSHVQLSVQQHDGVACLMVEDNGPGIPEKDRVEILKPFTRLSQSRTTAGNGLGLALVKAIVDAHQAHIELSDADPGLRVQVSFSDYQA